MIRGRSLRKRVAGDFISPLVRSDGGDTAVATTSAGTTRLPVSQSATNIKKPNLCEPATSSSSYSKLPLDQRRLKRVAASNHITSSSTLDQLELRIAELKKESVRLTEQIDSFTSQGLSTDDLDKHINLLHDYNELKDMGSALLGRLAHLKGISMNAMYKDYKLSKTD